MDIREGLNIFVAGIEKEVTSPYLDPGEAARLRHLAAPVVERLQSRTSWEQRPFVPANRIGLEEPNQTEDTIPEADQAAEA